MRYATGTLARVVCASVVLGGSLSALAPQSAWASSTTTKEKGTTSCYNSGSFPFPLKSVTSYDDTSAASLSEMFTVKLTLTIPASTTSAVYAAGIRSYDASLVNPWFDNSDATPSPYNAASNNTITAPVRPIQNNVKTKIVFSKIEAGPFTFTSAGIDQMTGGDPTDGFTGFNWNLYTTTNGAGKPTPVSFGCNPPASESGGSFVMATVNVS